MVRLAAGILNLMWGSDENSSKGEFRFESSSWSLNLAAYRKQMPRISK